MNKQRFPATIVALAAATLLLIAGLGAHVRAQNSASVSQRRAQLNTMLDEEWQWEMRESPIFATMYGDYRYNDRWDDFSLAHQAQRARDRRKFLARFEAVDTAGFPEQDRLNQELMVRRLNDDIEGSRLKTFEMPVDQFSGAQNLLAEFTSIVPADSVKHYEDYIARLNAICSSHRRFGYWPISVVG